MRAKSKSTTTTTTSTFFSLHHHILCPSLRSMASTSRSVLGLSTLRLTTSSASASRTYARPLHSSSSLRLADGDSSSSDAPTTSPGPARSNRTPSQSNLEQDAASSPSLPPKSPPSQQNRFQSQQAANNPTGAPPTRFDDLSLSSFPRFLDSPHPILDAVDYSQVPLSRRNPYGSSVSIYNDTKHFKPRPPSAATLALESGEGAPEDLEAGGDGKKRGGGRGGGQSTKPAEAATIAGLTPLTEGDVMGLHRQVLQTRRVVRQSGKGKIQSMAALIVVGDGRGMVGFGQGKAANAATAVKKAFRDAVGAMDFVERFEGRTIQRSVVGEWGATKVHLRPRPPVSTLALTTDGFVIP